MEGLSSIGVVTRKMVVPNELTFWLSLGQERIVFTEACPVIVFSRLIAIGVRV